MRGGGGGGIICLLYRNMHWGCFCYIGTCVVGLCSYCIETWAGNVTVIWEHALGDITVISEHAFGDNVIGGGR